MKSQVREETETSVVSPLKLGSRRSRIQRLIFMYVRRMGGNLPASFLIACPLPACRAIARERIVADPNRESRERGGVVVANVDDIARRNRTHGGCDHRLLRLAGVFLRDVFVGGRRDFLGNDSRRSGSCRAMFVSVISRKHAGYKWDKNHPSTLSFPSHYSSTRESDLSVCRESSKQICILLSRGIKCQI